MPSFSPRLGPPSWIWPAIVVVLLAGQLAICSVIIIASSTDPTVAIEPNYYEKAVSWDQHAAQRERSRQLGWTVTVAVDPAASSKDSRVVAIKLCDRGGDALRGATVRATAFHHAHARQRLETDFRDEGDGRYAAVLALDPNGIWEFRIQAQRGGDVFTAICEQPIGLPGSVTN